MKNLIGKYIHDKRICESICFIIQGYGILFLFALMASLDPILDRLFGTL